MTTHVISWSGGPDSTYGLLQFLRDTADPVVAVCVGAAVDSRYVRAFMRATRRLETPLRERTRDFRVVRYGITAENTVAEPSDEVTVLAMVTAMSYDDAILYWFCCAEDDQPSAWPVRNEALVERQTNLMKGVVTEKNLNREVGKGTIRKALGDLWDLTWSCLHPSDALEPCRRCEKCRERRRAELLARTA
ncbi:MAG: hypothetical protein U5K43_08300 [Halofilum sp. (in: g-proteobacteria)]|nr:hypothetical protein [Halofilum sp. (in: g-proteobacteria)]